MDQIEILVSKKLNDWNEKSIIPFKIIFELAENTINEFKDRSIEITNLRSRKKKEQRKKNSLRDLWYIIKYTNICT